MHRHFTERESSLANYHTRRQSSMGPEIGEEPSGAPRRLYFTSPDWQEPQSLTIPSAGEKGLK